MRLHFALIEDFAQGSLGKIGEAGWPALRPMLADMAGKQPGRPHFVRITQILGLAAGEIDDEIARGPRR
jgi:hypothetical protein